MARAGMTDTRPASCVPLLRANVERVASMRADGKGWKAIAAALGYPHAIVNLRKQWQLHFAHLSPRRRMIADLRDEAMAARARGEDWAAIAARFGTDVVSLRNEASRLGWTRR